MRNIGEIRKHCLLVRYGYIQSFQIRMRCQQITQFIDRCNGKRFIHAIADAFTLELISKILLGKSMAERIAYQTITFHCADSLSRNRWKVSPLNPTRIASSGSTSVGAILPKFTLAPISSMK